jgi:outer membrane protein TolC
MPIRHPEIEQVRPRFLNERMNRLTTWLLIVAIVAVVLPLPRAVFAQNTQTPPGQPAPSPSPQSTPAGTQGQQPGTPAPSPTQNPLTPASERQQSVQPQTGTPGQQTSPNTTAPQPISPQPISKPPSQNGLPATAAPVGTTPGQGPGATAPGTINTGVPGAPTSSIGISPDIAPAQLPAEPPPVAPNYRAPDRPLPSAERVGVDVSRQVPLSLNEAVALALQSNNDIDASRIDVKIAEFNLLSARGVYDPLFSSQNFYERRTTPTSSTIGGGANGSVTITDPTADVRLGGFTPFMGGSYQLDFSSTKLTTNNQFATLNPQYPTSFSLTYTQPLWRGLRFDLNRRNIEVAKKNLSLTDFQFRQRTIDVITQVQQAYWDLVFALRNLQIQIDAVKQARIQVESNQRQVDQGVLAPIDIVAATTQVTTFEQNVYTAQQAVTVAENSLKTLILPDRTAPLWSSAITPVTAVTLEPPVIPLEQAVTSALENRPELAQLKTNLEINKVNNRFYKELTKPQIDLVGTYNPVGLSGTLVPPSQTASRSTTPALTDRVNQLSLLAGLEALPATATSNAAVAPNLIGGYGQSLSNIFQNNYPTARIGVTISLPLRNRTAEANLGSSLALGSQINVQLAQTRQLIEADVRNNLQAIRSAQARLAAAAASRSSAEQQYASEERMFRAGTTTVFLVLQRQTALLAARGNELQAQTDLNKSIANFQRATGTTLSANNVAIRTDTPTRQLEIRPQSGNGDASSAAGESTGLMAP